MVFKYRRHESSSIACRAERPQPCPAAGRGARRVFLAPGSYAATLEQIADEAGFSTGAVYSRFASKADMFLALLEERIAERAAQNADLAGRLAGTGDFTAIVDLAQQADRAAPGWRLLVTEFRVHAARDCRPVADGVPSAKVLITNLHNLTQPLIRYELTDCFTPAGPQARICRVGALDRDPMAKIRRFVPLPAQRLAGPAAPPGPGG